MWLTTRTRWVITSSYNLCSHVVGDCNAYQCIGNVPAQCCMLLISCNVCHCQPEDIFRCFLLLFRGTAACVVLKFAVLDRHSHEMEHSVDSCVTEACHLTGTAVALLCQLTKWTADFVVTVLFVRHWIACFVSWMSAYLSSSIKRSPLIPVLTRTKNPVL